MNVQAQHFPLNKSLGNFKSIKSNKEDFIIQTDFGKAEIKIFSPSVIRIRIVKDNFADDFSYSVVAKPQTCKTSTKEDADLITITTDSIILKINKKPVRFSFTTLDGKIINEDEPAFGTSWIGDQVTTYKKLQDNERFIGLGEKTGNLDRAGNSYVNWNSDVPAYKSNQDPLYGTYPFYIGIHHQLNYGIFFDNTSRTQFNFGASNERFSSFTADLGEMTYYFIYHKQVAQIIESYTWLTGRMPMPPLWSLGYQQCRWSYYPDTEALRIAKTFREKKIPCDVLYFDINYMDNYKVFTWSPINFSKPKEMLSEMKLMGFRNVVIIDPGIKVEKNYKAYDDGVNNNMFVKYPDGKFYVGEVWAGKSHFPDFTNDKARIWWGNNFKGLVDDGVSGFWNDMNEIAVWGQSIPSLIEFSWEGKNASYLQAKNVYGMLMARSTFEGTKKLMNGKRPFVLTRAAYSGVQRYSAVWTGDNAATEEHILLGSRLINSMGLTGISYVGCDIGGFIGEPTKNMFTRWMTLGTFMPLYRSHAEIDAQSHEPWCFNKANEAIIRTYINLRYALLPYIYSAFHQSVATGLPVARSLAINNTFDGKIYDWLYQNQYLFGQSFLVAPVESTKDLVKVYLPDGEWYDMHTEKYFAGKQEIVAECPIDRLPVFIKGGSIIPTQSVVQSTAEKCSDTLTVHLYKGKSDNTFEYYEDDGETYNYADGQFYKRKIVYHSQTNELVFEKPDGSFVSKFKNVKVIFHQFDEIQKINVKGKTVSAKQQSFDFLHQKEIEWKNIKNKNVDFEFTNEKIIVNW